MSLPLLALIFLTAACLGVITTFLIWPKINYSWLAQTCRLLVISLPFERIPSLDSPIGNIRASQIFVLLGFYFMAILLLKKDPTLLQKKFNQYSLYLILFILFSLFSWFNIINFNRFLATFIATMLSFGAFFLLSNFSQNILKNIQELIISFLVVGFFGVYQFLGDMIGLPIWLTGLREQYTKIVFGIPRIHATAIEPLYFAGMLFLPIFASLVFILARKQLLIYKNFKYANFALLIFFAALFVLTLSKGAWLTMAIVAPIFILFAARKFRVLQLLKSLSNLSFIATGVFAISLLFSQTLLEISLRFWNHIWDTLSFEAATSVERSSFISTAWDILQDFIITGIGSGQYGVYSIKLLGNLNFTEGSFAIVNNVYLEIWLEHGIFSLVIFLFFILSPIVISLKDFIKKGKLEEDNQLAKFILVFSLLAYYIQWNFFSPIFIMPIFILLGLLSRILDLEKSK